MREQRPAPRASVEHAERLKAEAELRESEARYRHLIDVSPDAIAVHAEGKIVFVNPAAVTLLGAESELDLLGKPALEMVHPEDRAAALARIRKALESDRPAPPFRERFLRLDGTAVDVEVLAVPVIHQGRPAMQVIARDVTERLKAESALHESEDKFKYVFDHSPVGKSITLPTGELQANRALSEMLGYTAEELNGLRWQEITHPDDVGASEKAMEAVLSGERPSIRFEKRYLRKDGTVVWADVSLALRRDPKGRPQYFVTSVVDITKRRRAEDALRESEERFRAVFENGPVGMVLTGREFKFFSANPAFCRMLGYTAEEMSVRTFLDVTHPDHRSADRENVEKMWRGEIPQYKTEKRYLTKGGEVRWGLLTASLIQSRNGQPLFSLAVIQDITEQKKAEKTFRELSERNEAILETVPDIIAEVDHGKKYTWVNKAGRDFFGDDVIGRDASFYFEGEQATYDIVRPLFDGSPDTVYVESWQRRRDGEKRLLAWWCRPLKDSEGRNVGALSSARDITENKAAEDKIRNQLEELRRWHEVTIGRESRILELKGEVNRLLAESGRSPKYASVASPEAGPDKELSS